MFYLFTQNNSGGRFETDDKICHRVMIEAESRSDAMRIAETLGIYFDGVEAGIDCPCCGDRWYEPGEISFPHIYGLFNLSDATEIANKYDVTIIKHTKTSQLYDIVFDTPLKYISFLVDRYSLFTNIGDVACRIYYLSGVIDNVKKL